MDRREFCLGTISLGATMALPPIEEKSTTQNQPIRASYWAHQNLEVTGLWKPRLIEGQIPTDLNGSLYRFGAGKKESYGERLKHFFDGDGFVSRFDFSQGRLSILSEFIETEARLKEIQEQKMLYLEFGTKPQGKIHGLKNSPNISGILWENQLLALSESSSPYALDPKSLETQGLQRFQNSLPKNLGFSAHPKIESSTGDLISFGLTQELSPQFKIYKISKKQKIFQEIHSLKLGGFYPVHDMAQSEDYLVFLVPPVKVNLWGAAFGRKPIADLIESDDKKNLQLLVAPKNAKSPPIMLDTNIKNMNFHHVRAWQEGRFLFLDSFLIEDDSIYQTFKSWSSSLPTNSPHSKLVRFQIDLNTKKLQVIITLSEPTKSDFPVLLEEGRFVAISVSQSSSDSLGFNQILLWDQSSGSILKKLELSPGEVLSEVLPCQNYLVHLGYSLHQNESFLDIRDEKSLQRISRVWLGNSHPLGFHGFFNQV